MLFENNLKLVRMCGRSVCEALKQRAHKHKTVPLSEKKLVSERERERLTD